jgi:hypothetical protein
MPPVEFEPTISAGERSQTYALDRAATGIGLKMDMNLRYFCPHAKLYKRYRRRVGGVQI